MAVKIGSARIDERGKISGGKAGDQTGKEVSTQNWYKHSKGWRVLRAKDPAMRPYIAKAVEEACASSLIGYDQNQRSSLYNAIKGNGFDIGTLVKAVETDCSALVRVCASYACAQTGKSIVIADFYTANQASRLLATGLFEELKGSKYTDQSAYLCRGDVLVTKTKGHTVVVLTDGDKAEDTTPEADYKLGERTLRNGMSGADVKEMQTYLIQLGYDLGKWGADGDFGDSTEMGVEQFQRDQKLSADGIYGPNTHAALMEALNGEEPPAPVAKTVRIIGGNCYVRSAPNTSGAKLGVARNNTVHTYAGQTSEDGWHYIVWQGANGWVSGKYARLED